MTSEAATCVRCGHLRYHHRPGCGYRRHSQLGACGCRAYKAATHPSVLPEPPTPLMPPVEPTGIAEAEWSPVVDGGSAVEWLNENTRPTCDICGVADPDPERPLVDGVHEDCRDRDPKEPRNPDIDYEEDLGY